MTSSSANDGFVMAVGRERVTLNKLFCRGFIIAELNIFWEDIYWGSYQDRKNTRSVNNVSSFLVLSEREIDSGLIFTTSVFSLHVR